MACNPRHQLYDGSRPDYTNLLVFTSHIDRVTTVTAHGLTGASRIPLLVMDELGDYVPYLDENLSQVYLTASQPTVYVEDGRQYRLDTSQLANPSDVTVSTQTVFNDVESSVTAHLTHMCCSESTPIEIVRYRNLDFPIYFYLGTDEVMQQPSGRLTVERIEGAWPCRVNFQYDEDANELVIQLQDLKCNCLEVTPIIVRQTLNGTTTSSNHTTDLSGEVVLNVTPSLAGDITFTVDIPPNCTTIGTFTLPQEEVGD